jgi:hypothetical protein
MITAESQVVGRRQIESDAPPRFSMESVTSARSLLLSIRPWACPIRDHPVCENVHARSGVGFEHERRCPQHNLVWDPDFDLILAVAGYCLPEAAVIHFDLRVSSAAPTRKDFPDGGNHLLFCLQTDGIHAIGFTV